MNNTVTRTISGSVYILIIIASLIWQPIAFGLVTLFFNVIALNEWNNMGRKMYITHSNQWIPANIIFFVAAIAVIDTGFFSWSWLALCIVLPFWYFIRELFAKRENPIFHVSFINFGMLYISLPLILLNIIQYYSLQQMIPFTLAMFIIIWINDTFAYLSGKAFGKHKMFARISPKKSWEGFAGGLIMVLVAAMLFHYFFRSVALYKWFIFAFLTALSAVIGDFMESLLKRTAGVKDSGNIMPGHGGVLDRIDSLLLASPVIFIYLLLIQNL